MDLNTKSGLINITSITDFDPYEYTIARYKKEDFEVSFCSFSLGLFFCFNQCIDNDIVIVEQPRTKSENRKYQIEYKEILP